MNKRIPYPSIIFIILIMSSAQAQSVSGNYDITRYGAVPNNGELCTGAINKAVEVCSDNGGGTVIVPSGTFISGTIILKSKVTLHLDPGAVIKGSGNMNDYKVDGNVEGLIFAKEASHVSVTGPGILDGNGTHFMNMHKLRIGGDAFQYTRQGKDYLSGSDGIADGPVVPLERPAEMLRFMHCSNVLLQGVTIHDAPNWTIHLGDCSDSNIMGITIENNLLIPNNDGIHLTTCQNIHISDCDIKTGDDAIAVTGLTFYTEHDQHEVYKKTYTDSVCKNITVANCTLESRSSGVRIGYGAHSIEDCTFSNLVIHDSNRGIGIFVRGKGSVKNITFDNIIIKTRLHTGQWWGNGESIHVSCLRRLANTPLGSIQNVRFSNITAESENGILVYGVGDSPVRNLEFDNVHVKILNSRLNKTFGGNFDLRPAAELSESIFKHEIPGFYGQYIDGLKLNNVTINWAKGLPDFFTYALQLSHFTNVDINEFTGRQPHSGDLTHSAISLSHGRSVNVRNCRAPEGTGIFLSYSNIRGKGLFVNNDLRNAQKTILPSKDGFLFESNLLPGQ